MQKSTTPATWTIQNHWVTHAFRSPSPFYSLRPDPDEISLLVIHNISLPPEQFGTPYIEQLFLGRLDPEAHPYFKSIAHLEVSAHCLIRRDGEIMQFVGFDKKAWHAGVSSYHGREACNDFSIGIELEGADHIPYTDIQYLHLAKLTTLLCQHYPFLSQETIVGHNAIAPERKTDPGPSFNWDYFYTLLGHSID